MRLLLSLKFWLGFSAVLMIVFSWYGYDQYKKHSLAKILQKQLQQILDDNQIPVKILTFEIDADPRSLLNGKIRRLESELLFVPQNLRFTIKTPVDYVLTLNHIDLALEPSFRVKTYPDFSGKIQATVNFKREGRTVKLGGITSTVALKTSEDLRLEFDSTKIQASTIVLNAKIDLKPDRTPPIRIDSDITIARPAFQQEKLRLKEIELVLQTHLEAGLDGFTNSSVTIKKPWEVKLKGDLKNSQLNTQVSFNSAIRPLIERLKILIEAPILSQIDGDGDLFLDGKITGPLAQPSFHGNLALVAPELELTNLIGSEGLSLENFSIQTPIVYPFEETEGKLSVEKLTLMNFEAKGLEIATSTDEDKLHFKLQKPLRFEAFEQFINLNQLSVRIPLLPHQSGEKMITLPGVSFPISISAGVSGGPFKLANLQRDLCIIPRKPFDGEAIFNYPRIFNSADGMHFIGEATLDIFNGKAYTRNIHYLWKNKKPSLRLNAEVKDLDMGKIGAWTGFGDMRGSLDMSLSDAEYLLTSHGLEPIGYDLVFRPIPRGERPVALYGRAANNVIEVVSMSSGIIKEATKFITNVLITVRNYFPITAEYSGFRAKADQNFTELYTFDPETTETKEPKQRYFFYGSGLKIPMNSGGRYPGVMRTVVFNTYIRDAINRIKSMDPDTQLAQTDLNKMKELEQNRCTPFWEIEKNEEQSEHVQQ